MQIKIGQFTGQVVQLKIRYTSSYYLTRK